jgi:hypothetical protein
MCTDFLRRERSEIKKSRPRRQASLASISEWVRDGDASDANGTSPTKIQRLKLFNLKQLSHNPERGARRVDSPSASWGM